MFIRITAKLLIFATACLGMVAHAGEKTINEIEVNHPIETSQSLSIPGAALVPAALGNGGSDDLDYFSFRATAGDVVTIDINNGIGGAQSVDTVLAVFDGGPEHKILRFNDDATSPDDGSISQYDSRIDDFVAPTTGRYIVGVSSFPRYFQDGGDVLYPDYAKEGDYSLEITGVTAQVKQVAIRVKPGKGKVKPINPKSRGNIPVTILGGPDFNPLNIDTDTLTFGATGEENSLVKCNRKGVDLNQDGRIDRLCHFDNRKAGFRMTDAEGTVRGQTRDGTAFEGTGYLNVVPAEKAQH